MNLSEAVAIVEEEIRKRGMAVRRVATPVDILIAVSEAFGVPIECICGRIRTRQVVLARFAAVALFRERTHFSYPDITRAMMRPNHSTPITQHRRAMELLTTDEDFKARYLDAKARLDRA